ncbi:hypothetical protein A3J90_00545 [candidate division WOR-1 bacterium RIFOXYC2_FULL_37_10]|nr:MAG: hypothetical protein A3J90_00545 [candidate division WOR-1 bacterium RIFOXYC2_FULL_37_10]
MRGNCGVNIELLGNKFKEAGISMGSAKVLLMQTASGATYFPEVRGGHATNWLFHVVLEYEGLIFDLDYPYPEAISFQEYFGRHIPAWTAYNLSLTVIPWEEYNPKKIPIYLKANGELE